MLTVSGRRSLHTAHSSKGLRSKQKNKSNFARKVKGPTLAKAFFPEKQSCDCCHGYIYGCDETVCHELGKCICSLEEGEGTGDVKRKKVRKGGIAVGGIVYFLIFKD